MSKVRKVWTRRRPAKSSLVHNRGISKDEQLERVPHPIQRYCDDILRLIFEECVYENYPEFMISVRLSHVCRRWRMLTISTPSLWRKVTFLISPSKENTNSSLAEVFIARAKHVPVDIRIYANDNYLGSDRLAAMQALKSPYLHRILSVPSIDALDVRLHGIKKLGESIINNMDIVPNTEIRSLTVYSNENDKFPLDAFIAKFLPMRKLCLVGITFGSIFDGNLSLTVAHLVDVTIANCFYFPLSAFLRMTPAVRKLSITSCYNENDAGHANDVWDLPALHSLEIDNTEVPWELIKCPQLVQFRTPVLWKDKDYVDIWRFLTKTSTIREINGTLIYCPQHFISLANTAPQITSLNAPARPEFLELLTNPHDFGLQEPAFPNLVRLTTRLDERTTRPFALENFIRARCLPRDHILSTMDRRIAHPLEALTILIPPSSFKGRWKQLLEANFIRTTLPSNDDITYDPEMGPEFLAWAKAEKHGWDGFSI
ncbi:hypothetical protein M408DRAFT_24589 [Serendipita vermifera MAFF 305830]|uniref:F-box domain-containing protein n=1 Tax=Serendipita vermifera MAFF 305830 TaxID=933852 RepID=A0A0C2XE22_SERVB|nr:hypothetical protein M408DRAFT_24589 [Serendipita vermifera MAFF 305830]